MKVAIEYVKEWDEESNLFISNWVFADPKVGKIYPLYDTETNQIDWQDIK